MKIFLSGGTGFIGSHIARILFREGHEVHALIKPNTDLSRIQDLAPSVHLIHADLEDHDKVKSELKNIKPDAALHLAWTTNPENYWKTPENLTLLQNSIELAKILADSGCKKIITTGTCFEYDTTLGILSESSPIKPKSLYAACKHALYLALDQFCKQQEIQFVWPRFFYLYGPHEHKKRFVPNLILSLLEGKEIFNPPGVLIRDYLHVEDAAAAVCALTSSSLSGPVNIGSGTPVHIRDLMEITAKILETLNLKKDKNLNLKKLINFKNHPVCLDDPILILADNRRLVENTSWKPEYDLAKGIEQTIQWWSQQVESARRV
jgi:nucleoside-diphosphate-sugar epimerase